MLIREFICEKCDKVFEHIYVKIADGCDAEACPSCHSSHAVHWKPSSFQAATFKPWVSQEIIVGGRPAQITSARQRDRLFKDHGLRLSPINDTAEGRADYREFHPSNWEQTGKRQQKEREQTALKNGVSVHHGALEPLQGSSPVLDTEAKKVAAEFESIQRARNGSGLRSGLKRP